MIAVDASAILSIYLEEPDANDFRAVVEHHGGVMSAVNYWEVLARAHRVHGTAAAERVENLMRLLGVAVVPASVNDARQAYNAFARFGRGAAGPLNLGDCFAYALAQDAGDGLLFKGEDFPKTDVKSALA